MKPVGVAIVGTGYWGPNLFRNFLGSESAELRWVCDLVGDRRADDTGTAGDEEALAGNGCVHRETSHR